METNENNKLNDLVQAVVDKDEELQEVMRKAQEAGADMSQMKLGITFVDDPEEKKYLILLSEYLDDEIITNWSVYTGRQKVYEFLKNLVESEAIDPDTSFVLESSMEAKDAVTVHAFLKHMSSTNKVFDKGRPIEDILDYDPVSAKLMEN